MIKGFYSKAGEQVPDGMTATTNLMGEEEIEIDV
jgi:hypothetical protein